MTEWKRYRLGEVCARLRSGKGIPSSMVLNEGKYPVIGGNGVRGYTDEPNFKGGCAVIGRQGAYCGNVRYFNGEAYMTEHAIVAVGKEDIADNYYLALRLGLMNLGNLSAQSAQPGISVQTLKERELSLPPLPLQRRIAGVLSSLDNKIETNRKINARLEELAQALFRSWFIDFTPFKDGEFVEDEFGRRPKGWEVGCLRDIAEINPFRKLTKDTEARYIDMASLNTQCAFPHSWTFKPYNGGMKFKNGDTIIARITPCLENGKTAFINFLEDKEVAFGSTEYVVISPKEGYYPEFFYCLSRNESFRDYAVSHMNGTSGRQRVAGDDIANYHILIPQPEIVKPLGLALKAIMEKVKANGIENARLSALRDTLLPKLMSGEIMPEEITI